MAIGFECLLCQVEVSAVGRSLVQRSLTEYVCVVIIRHNNNFLRLQWIEEARLKKMLFDII
jgi:hypothetical protein